MIIIFVTAKDQKEARKIGLTLVSQRLAACINIIPNINSIFWWNRKIENINEALLLIKTTKKLQPIVFERVKELHSYEVPEMIGLPVKYIEKRYLNWMKNNITYAK